ncbi:FIG00450475: hypothetical protein [hydrothermal vent metagenome]|uniref:Uncharacterized protein n=1 Tax=hydrothermal vent metagenome TaxID=652676 RepID=A0A3B0RQ66_9ZZZZ
MPVQDLGMTEALNNRIIRVELDPNSLAATSAESEHERRVAIFDLLEDNYFCPAGDAVGPFVLGLSILERRLVLDIALEDGTPVKRHLLSLSPFRRIIRDYFMICESYYDAIRNAPPERIEAMDMGRRGLHNEGSDLLEARLEDKVEMDFDTARRLFTLLCSLHVRQPV